LPVVKLKLRLRIAFLFARRKNAGAAIEG